MVLMLLAAVMFSGCLQRIAVSSLGGIIDDGFTVLNEEQDLQIAQVSIPSNLTLLETILRSDPGNSHYLLLASMGYSSYALAFVEDDSAARARMLYERGRDYGLKILNADSRLAAALRGTPEELTAALNESGRDELPAVFWTAIGWGSAIALSINEPSSLADLPKVEAMMQWAHDNDSAYFYAGADCFLGTLAGSRPTMFGGDPKAALQHFESAIRINRGRFLMTYVYYARSYAVQTQNRELFEHCLNTIDSASTDILPEARLSNAVAKRKAQLLRSRIDELF
jgi:hypothetical protein